MKHLRFVFDVVSPYAYLAFERLPQVLEGVSAEVSYQPVFLHGLLQHWGQKPPVSIEPKRAWIYRQVGWLAQHFEIPLHMPAAHPFNPLPLLRLLLATAPTGGTPNRWACEQVLHHVWRRGGEAVDPQVVNALAAQLSPRRDPASTEVKDELRQLTEAAAQRGAFGVPSVEVDGRLFWGVDGLEMLRDCLQQDDWFASGTWERADRLPSGRVEVGALSPATPPPPSDATRR